jgi:Secretion system C-terminal sorting domain
MIDLSTLAVDTWNEFVLDSSLILSGNDLWVCVQVEDTTGLNYPLGCDNGPANADGDWVNDDGNWKHLNADYGLNYNWNIRAVIMPPVTDVNVNLQKIQSFNLAQNYPNPFNPTTNITYNIPKSGNVTLSVYNMLGQQVALLINGIVTEGSHTTTFNASQLPSGVYFYKLQQGNNATVKKMLLLK